jgi:D-alanyl-D-alanine carboxypeptidase (penicillin-binding protein 5/6)
MRSPLRALVAAGVLALVAAAPAAAQDAVARPDRLPGGVVVAPTAPPLPTEITAAAWLVADLDTGEVLAARDAHGRFAPASTLKVLTALALLPEVPPEQVVVPSRVEVEIEGSKVGLLAGVAYPAEELYASLLMVSGNDSGNALGGAAGGQAVAAGVMNATAARLGAVDTHAVNQHGLDAEGQLTTPYDLAVIARAALDEPDIARWVATKRSTMSAGSGQPRFEIVNHNKLLGSFEGALGLKNGYTSRARASFIGAAERDGRRLVATLMRAEPRVWAEAGRLLEWGFAAAAADVRPVGELPAPAPEEPQDDAAKDDEVSDVVASPATGGVDLPGLPARELAGAFLVVAALVAVRPARRPARRPA